MTFDEFESRIASVLEREPQLRRRLGEGPVSKEAIDEAERVLGVKFPQEYREFVGKYGGGYFMFGDIYTPGDIVFQNAKDYRITHAPDVLFVRSYAVGMIRASLKHESTPMHRHRLHPMVDRRAACFYVHRGTAL